MAISIFRTEEGIAILKVVGRLSIHTTEAAQQQIDQLINEGLRFLVFDLTSMDFVSSAGLGVFVHTFRKLEAQNGKMRLCGLQDEVKRLFDITGLSFRLDLYPSLEEALIGFPPGNTSE